MAKHCHLAIHTSGGPLVIVYDTYAEGQQDYNAIGTAMSNGQPRLALGARSILAGTRDVQEVYLTVSPVNIAAMLLVGDK